MRIVSWNVNGIRAGVRHGFVDFVDRSGADIVGVQEVRARPEDIPPAARRPPGWHTAFTVAERLGYSGVGLYSKLQPVRVDTSLGVPRFDREGRFMAAHFQTARGRFVVVNGYFPKDTMEALLVDRLDEPHGRGVEIRAFRRQPDRPHIATRQDLAKYPRVERIAVMNQLTRGSQEAIDWIGQIAGHLFHPPASGLRVDPSDVHTAGLQRDHEDDEIPPKTGQGEHFDRE